MQVVTEPRGYALLRAVAVVFGVIGALGSLDPTWVSAQTTQPMDQDFAERVCDWTTRPEFISPLVDHLPVDDTVPAPVEVLGHHAGVPRELTYYSELLS